jgi:hypothetical protein
MTGRGCFSWGAGLHWIPEPCVLSTTDTYAQYVRACRSRHLI